MLLTLVLFWFQLYQSVFKITIKISRLNNPEPVYFFKLIFSNHDIILYYYWPFLNFESKFYLFIFYSNEYCKN
jgi:hypothetical protein